MPLKVEDSWRIVDGENDSFDTSILPSADSDDILLPLSSENPSSGFPSQLSSQSQGASQDSIRDFVKHQEDDKVILREPFRPSVPSVASLSPRHNTYRTPDPEFTMPVLDTDDHHSSGRSSATVRPNATSRRRGVAPTSSSSTARSPVKRSAMRRRIDKGKHAERDHGRSTVAEVSNWLFSVVGLAFRFAKRPLALFLAIYVLCGALVMTENMLQESVLLSLSPICRIPGTSYLNLPFCPDWMPGTGSKMAAPIEFEGLVKAQSRFEQVLEKSAEGVSLPYEMKRSESSVRDLRSLVRDSQLESREELVAQFDAYIELAGDALDALTRFNVRVSGIIDRVLLINRRTSRDIASLQESPSVSVMSSISNWLLYPFQPSETAIRELTLRQKYIAHTDFISESIDEVLLEGQQLLDLFATVDDRLIAIQRISSQLSASIETHRSKVLYSLWTLVGAHTGKLRDISRRLSLLNQADYQRMSAVTLVTTLVVDLKAIQATLGVLKDQVAEPNATLERDDSAAQLPLNVHIETLDMSVQRLEAARTRIRAAEEIRVQDILARRGVRRDPEGLLDPPKK